MSRESGSTRGGDLADLWEYPDRTIPPAERVGLMGLRLLDRYVLRSWLRIFVLTALGFPIVSILINLTDTLKQLLDRGLDPQGDRGQLLLLHSRERLPGDAGGGAVRHRLHRGQSGAALGAHRGQGGRAELLPR